MDSGTRTVNVLMIDHCLSLALNQTEIEFRSSFPCALEKKWNRQSQLQSTCESRYTASCVPGNIHRKGVIVLSRLWSTLVDKSAARDGCWWPLPNLSFVRGRNMYENLLRTKYVRETFCAGTRKRSCKSCFWIPHGLWAGCFSFCRNFSCCSTR